MIQSSSSQGNMDDTVRRLEKQLQEDWKNSFKNIESEKSSSKKRAEELQKQVKSSNIRPRPLKDKWLTPAQELRHFRDSHKNFTKEMKRQKKSATCGEILD